MNAVDFIKNWEGSEEGIGRGMGGLYICPAGFPTIGYGHRITDWSMDDFAFKAGLAALTLREIIKADHGQWLTEEQATALMLPAVAAAEAKAKALFAPLGWEAIGEPRQIALTDLCYNMGGLSAFPNFRLAVQAGRWQAAHDHLLYVDGPDSPKTRYHEQVGKRARCNAEIILTGVMPDPLP